MGRGEGLYSIDLNNKEIKTISVVFDDRAIHSYSANELSKLETEIKKFNELKEYYQKL